MASPWLSRLEAIARAAEGLATATEPEPLGAPERPHRVRCHLDRVLAVRGMTLVELSARTGIGVVNPSVLRNDRARAVRFSTLTALCDALGCAPGDLFTVARPPLTPPASSKIARIRHALGVRAESWRSWKGGGAISRGGVRR